MLAVAVLASGGEGVGAAGDVAVTVVGVGVFLDHRPGRVVVVWLASWLRGVQVLVVVTPLPRVVVWIRDIES